MISRTAGDAWPWGGTSTTGGCWVLMQVSGVPLACLAEEGCRPATHSCPLSLPWAALAGTVTDKDACKFRLYSPWEDGSNPLLLLLRHFSHVRYFATPWTVACQAPLSMGFSRQEHWSGLPCLPRGDLPDPGMNTGVGCHACPEGIFLTLASNLCLLCTLHRQAGSSPLAPPGEPNLTAHWKQSWRHASTLPFKQQIFTRHLLRAMHSVRWFMWVQVSVKTLALQILSSLSHHKWS